jgi:anaerobic ribonucleoside-triphosphate reductase activating protein
LLWTSNGTELTKAQLQAYLDKYKGLASCVLFMGGDWDPNLGELLALAKASGYKTALYSGYELEQVNKELLDQLDYLKYGPWVEALGGLGSPSTNQRFMHVPTWTCLNHLFHQRG